MKIEWEGTEKLAMKLLEKSVEDFISVNRKNARDIYTRSQKQGGTPVDTTELRTSARYRGDEVGYNKDYGPHVEYGHKLKNGGYVPGQYYLKRNVDTQRPIYKQDLKDKLKE